MLHLFMSWSHDQALLQGERLCKEGRKVTLVYLKANKTCAIVFGRKRQNATPKVLKMKGILGEVPGSSFFFFLMNWRLRLHIGIQVFETFSQHTSQNLGCSPTNSGHFWKIKGSPNLKNVGSSLFLRSQNKNQGVGFFVQLITLPTLSFPCTCSDCIGGVVGELPNAWGIWGNPFSLDQEVWVITSCHASCFISAIR